MKRDLIKMKHFIVIIHIICNCDICTSWMPTSKMVQVQIHAL